ncbi:MerR family transcriptional regulator [Staphylococcus cohnii]
MQMTVKEIANLVGISVRTLHYYDEINLLNPTKLSKSGYRLYSETDLDKLQQILFFRELDFSLKKIKSIIDSPSFDRQEALKMHKQLLIERKNRTDQMIQTIDQTLRHMKGEITMTNKEKFEGFNFDNSPQSYDEEARKKWGDSMIIKANQPINSWSDKEKDVKTKEMNDIFSTFANLKSQPPESVVVQSNVQKWYDYLNSNLDFNYTLDIFESLGNMYVEDERFKVNIDKFGTGTAQFIKDAIDVYVKNKQ